MSAEISDLLRILKSQIGESGDVVSIGYQTGLDECFFIGTRVSFLRFAGALIEAVVDNGAVKDVFGVDCRSSTHLHDVTSELSDIRVSGEVIVEKDEDRSFLARQFSYWDQKGKPGKV